MSIKEKGHVIICNCPHEDKVNALVNEFRANREYRDVLFVLISDKFEELPDKLNGSHIQFVKGNPMDEAVLHKANVSDCKGVVVLARNQNDSDSDAQTFVIGTIIESIEKEIGRSINVIMEQVGKANDKMMRRAGTDGIVTRGEMSNNLLVQEFMHPGVYEMFKQLTSNLVGRQFYIFETKLEGFTVGDIQHSFVDSDRCIQLIGMIRNGEHMLNPTKTTVVEKNDQLIILAETADDYDHEQEALYKTKN